MGRKAPRSPSGPFEYSNAQLSATGKRCLSASSPASVTIQGAMGDGRRVTCARRCRLWCCSTCLSLSLSLKSVYQVGARSLSCEQRDSRYAVAEETSRNNARHGKDTRLSDDSGAPHFPERLIVRGKNKLLTLRSETHVASAAVM